MKPQSASRITITASGKQSRRLEDDKVTGRQGDKALRAWRIGLIKATWARVVARAMAGEVIP